MSVDDTNTPNLEKAIKNVEKAFERFAECFTSPKENASDDPYPISEEDSVYILIGRTFEEGRGKLVSILGVYTDLNEAKKEIETIKDKAYDDNKERLKQDSSLNLEFSMTDERISYSIGKLSESYHIVKCELNKKEQYSIYYEKERNL